MWIDDFQGEKVNIEDTDEVSNEKLVEMEREYFSHLIDPHTARYWGKDYVDRVGQDYDTIVEEIGYRRRDREWV
ncbi:hypothetical protein SEA_YOUNGMONEYMATA_104 [Mycobacterium phage YoungMoneyMata]|uniref:Uncharacterized protein n=1 Tax=Mycobacterium phage Quasimodo TaxID=2762409 RepID=A0A7G8LNZ7_9CAUD|nr:hypothetical protein KHO64_gp219 [Mycobacterium phage Quasimodo]QAX95138.1 hypothetical protein SEA_DRPHINKDADDY_102 [Mycobacterium phage DrPhinkDaddy]QAY15064.1 hypothetical protein SEA_CHICKENPHENDER_99 [Mycobacterium phage ChickenPhender]QED12019.1 hypothetical protein SEA_YOUNGMONEYMATA_104 [Mycobacterium phage YoungMoneyMata]QNJ58733.1 hypothetical protein SEA_CHAYLAJR_98 [Mycobacterium phage ChaylaJr]QNJ58969.1 hypothetical protein SEA_QUASIMODO_104 [Mycobacterium phage Quasimodo]